MEGMIMVYDFENKEFVESQRKQRECLATCGTVDFSYLTEFDIAGAVGTALVPISWLISTFDTPLKMNRYEAGIGSRWT
jgi:hypothetical protein